jgi:hypothetical protein
MSCNDLLQKCTRHSRTLPTLTDIEAAVSREACVRGLSSFSEGVIVTQKCAMGERA